MDDITVTVRVIGHDPFAKREDKSVALPLQATLGQALGEILNQCGLDVPLDKFAASTFLVNNKRAFLDYVLEDGDCLQVLRTLEGG